MDRVTLKWYYKIPCNRRVRYVWFFWRERTNFKIARRFWDILNSFRDSVEERTRWNVSWTSHTKDAALDGGSTVPDHGGRPRVSFDLVNRTALSWIYILLYVPFPRCALRPALKKTKTAKERRENRRRRMGYLGACSLAKCISINSMA